MTSVVGRIGQLAWVGTLVWAVGAAGPALGQTTGQASGAPDTSVAHRPAGAPGQASAPSPPQGGSIIGLVVDSLYGRPLVGAQISVEGVNSQAFTDSTGRFRVDSVPAGRYRIGVFHPLLDSLELSIASPPLAVAAGKTLSVIFATPSAATFVRLSCGDMAVDTMAGIGRAVLIGHVLDAETDAPAAGVRVSLHWIDIQASPSIGVHRIVRVRDTTTGPSGQFRFCHLPSQLAGTARATSVTADSVAVSRPYAMNGRLVGFLVLHVPGIDTAARHSAHGAPSDGSAVSLAGGGVLTGRVTRPDGGGPFAGAQVMVLGSKQTAVTGDSGQFTLRGLPTGSRTLEVRALGWEPVTLAVDLAQRETRQVVVPLAIKTAVLQAVVVTATLNAGLHRVGYDARKQMGIGHFLGPDDIANRNAFEFADLMMGMPGVLRRPGPNGEDYLTGSRGGGGCVGYYVDGIQYHEMTRGDINTYVRPDDIGAVEMYQPSEAPAQYAYSAPSMSAPSMSGGGGRGNAMMRSAGTMGATSGSGGTGCVKILIWTKGRLGL